MVTWVLEVIERGGYWGVFALMVLENLFPPIPSELIMPLAGYQSAVGKLDPFWVMVAGTLGSVVGALPWYWGARALGYDRLASLLKRHGVWFALAPADLHKAHTWFQRRGWIAVLFGRLVPGIRTLISAPAGVFTMPFATFLVLTAIGSAVWVGLLTAAGYALEHHYHQIGAYLDPIAAIVLATLIALYLRRVASHFLKLRQSANS